MIAFWMLSTMPELTNAIFGTVVFSGEVVAVTNLHFSAPDVNDPPYGQVTVFVELLVYSTSLRPSTYTRTISSSGLIYNYLYLTVKLLEKRYH